MPKEIERKYLPASDAWKNLVQGVYYRQGYLCAGPECAVRVRVAGEKAWLTVKGGTQGAVRSEFEYPIPLKEAEAMLDELALRPLIEKTRHAIPYAGKIWEVDEFHGENQGLILIEVELDHELESPPKPDWVGPEVTNDPKYYNAALVKHPYSLWKDR